MAKDNLAEHGYGLTLLPKDSRDFKLGAFTVLPHPDTLPDEFELENPFPIKNQGTTDFCSAYASTGVSELQEGVELLPEYSFSASKAISGNEEEWGQDLRSACKAHVKYGALPVKDIDKDITPAEARYFKNFEHLLNKALPHRKQSFFSVEGNFEPYDNIRSTIFKYKDEKRAVIIGVIFSWNPSEYILDNPTDSGFGHAMYVTGWDKDGLIVVNSYGDKSGKGGKHRMPRETVNRFVGRFGAYTFLDIEKDTARELLDRAEWTRASWCGRIMIVIRNWWRDIWA